MTGPGPVHRSRPPRPPPDERPARVRKIGISLLCGSLAILVATSIYLNDPAGTPLRQLCISSLPNLLKHMESFSREGAALTTGSVSWPCRFSKSTRSGMTVIRSYSLHGQFVLQYELDWWPP